MKNYFTPKIALIIVLSLTLACCKEDPPPPDPPCMDGALPCATQEGKNTFGCYIDGEPFVADVKFTVGGPVAVSATYNENTKYVQISGTRDKGIDDLEKVYFCFFANNGVASYSMYSIVDDLEGFTDFTDNVEYFHDTTSFGQVDVSNIDTSVKFISGTFEMTLKNTAYGADSLMVITGGRFDIRY